MGELKRLRDVEKEATDEFCPIPFHYMEIALLFMDRMEDSSRAMMLLREIIEARREKIRQGLQAFNPESIDEMNVTNMSAVELSCFRTRSLHAMDSFYALDQKAKKIGLAGG